MPDTVNGKNIFSLLEVASSIQKTLSLRYTSSFWVKAEMNKLNHYPHSGHCYPDLVEKMEGKVIAQLKSTLWKDDYLRINRNFLSVVKSPLKDGIKMLFCARITFDPIHGLALRITDIDPVFSLGELEREKQESIDRLKSEGIFDRNKSLPFPLLPQRLAIISVQTSKGLADFNKIIDGNPWGYKFVHVLFPSLLQGDRAVESIRYQLGRIRRVVSHFDVVAIIRGGGGEVGLSCFNDFGLAREIALFPIPVITGIGHATNETVVETVAFKNAITPTELADFLLQKFHNFSLPVKRAEEVLAGKVPRIVSDARERLLHTVRYFRSVTGHVLIDSHHIVQNQARALFKQSTLMILSERQLQASSVHKLRTFSANVFDDAQLAIVQRITEMRKGTSGFVKQERNVLAGLERTVGNMHPQNVLKRGYSITRVNGKSATSVNQVQASDRIETLLADGNIYSEVSSIKKSSEL